MTQNMVDKALPQISLLDIEDRMNTALNATLAMHDLTEGFLNSMPQLHHDIAEEANTNAYMIGHCREMVREAHGIFHQFLAQEFAKMRKARV